MLYPFRVFLWACTGEVWHYQRRKSLVIIWQYFFYIMNMMWQCNIGRKKKQTKKSIIKTSSGLFFFLVCGANSTHIRHPNYSCLTPFLSSAPILHAVHSSPLQFLNFDLMYASIHYLFGIAPKPPLCDSPTPFPQSCAWQHNSSVSSSKHTPSAYFSHVHSCQACYSPSSRPHQCWGI